MNNADKALEDADGFAAKLTTGDGNVFDGCISAYNADDGWDLFAKVATGSIGTVRIRNSIAYKNGYLMVASGDAKSFELAEVLCDDNGTLTFRGGEEMEAGNGNGFKMGGSNMPGGHMLTNSIAYENKAKGIDSNSCPDIKVANCTSYNNNSYNLAMYTNSKDAKTAYAADGIISFRDAAGMDLGENIGLQKQSDSAAYGKTNYYWDPENQSSSNTLGETVSGDWFVSLDTSIQPARAEDGSIDMHGLLLLTDTARAATAAGARGKAWGQKEATIWAIGDSTVSRFSDKYYIPRVGYGEELGTYLNAKVYNLAHSGASSKDFTTMWEYDALLHGTLDIPAMGTQGGDQFLVIGFGHNDEKTEDARFTEPNGDYKAEGSFANSLYVNYIKPALDAGVTPIVVTPIARLTNDNTTESYNSASGHVTSDTVIGDVTYPGGNYAQAIRDLTAAIQAEGYDIACIDLTEATIAENVALGEDAKWLHAFTGAKHGEQGEVIATGLDQTHTNEYGAKLHAWMIADLGAAQGLKLADYSFGKPMPTYEEAFDASINEEYEIIDYKAPTPEQMDQVSWPQFTDADGQIWRGTAFGDIGGEEKINSDNFTAQLLEDGSGMLLGVANNTGKIASGSDGYLFYYVQLPAGTRFTLTGKATIQSFFANNQVSFGLMARDDLYIDSYVPTTMGDYVAAGIRNQGNIINFGRQSSALIGAQAGETADLGEGREIELKLVGQTDGYTLTFGDTTSSAGFDYALTAVDDAYIYVGFYTTRNCSVIFQDIHLTID